MMFGGYTGAPEGAEERLLAAAQWERDVAAKALREVAAEVRQLPPDASPRGIAAAIAVKADRIGREGGESDE